MKKSISFIYSAMAVLVCLVACNRDTDIFQEVYYYDFEPNLIFSSIDSINRTDSGTYLFPADSIVLVPLDLDKDSVIDFEVKIWHEPNSDAGEPYYNYFVFLYAKEHAFISDYNGNSDPREAYYSVGEIIQDDSINWYPDFPICFHEFMYSSFYTSSRDSTHYIGFKLVKNNADYFGWIRCCDYSHENPLVIYDYAISLTPNYPLEVKSEY